MPFKSRHGHLTSRLAHTSDCRPILPAILPQWKLCFAYSIKLQQIDKEATYRKDSSGFTSGCNILKFQPINKDATSKGFQRITLWDATSQRSSNWFIHIHKHTFGIFDLAMWHHVTHGDVMEMANLAIWHHGWPNYRPILSYILLQ